MAAGSERFDYSENAILELIDSYFGNNAPALQLGRGDDCAIFADALHLCTSSDLFLEDVHFRQRYFTPEDIGYKALAVNLSDLAAMGAKPLAFNMCLGLPPSRELSWLKQFFAGMASLAQKEHVLLAGGDLSVADKLHISITVFGQRQENSVFLRRGGIMAGDTLFLVGQIGLARIGLEEMEKYERAAFTQWPVACAAHLRPEPQVDAGLILARAGSNARPPALMDVSDGLASDLPRLLSPSRGARSLGAELHIPAESLHEEVLRHAFNDEKKAVEAAFLGGEDYALLGACAPDMLVSLRAAIPGLRQIGIVRPGGRIFVNDREMTGKTGFDHFSNS